jgi:hypothetical protein
MKSVFLKKLLICLLFISMHEANGQTKQELRKAEELLELLAGKIIQVYYTLLGWDGFSLHI